MQTAKFQIFAPQMPPRAAADALPCPSPFSTPLALTFRTYQWYTFITCGLTSVLYQQ